MGLVPVLEVDVAGVGDAFRVDDVVVVLAATELPDSVADVAAEETVVPEPPETEVEDSDDEVTGSVLIVEAVAPKLEVLGTALVPLEGKAGLPPIS